MERLQPRREVHYAPFVVPNLFTFQLHGAAEFLLSSVGRFALGSLSQQLQLVFVGLELPLMMTEAPGKALGLYAPPGHEQDPLRIVAQQRQHAPQALSPPTFLEVRPHLVDHRGAVPVSPQSLASSVSFPVAGVSLYASALRAQGSHVVLQHQGAIVGHVRVVAAYLSDDGLVTIDRKTPKNTIVEVVVFSGPVGSIEVAHGVESKTPIHYRGHVDRATAQQLEVRVVFDPKLLPLRDHGAIGGDLPTNP